MPMSNHTRRIPLGAGQCLSFHQGLNQSNRIDVQAKGNKIDVFVNGVYLVSVTDSKQQRGQIGVQMGSGDAVAEVTYSGLKVWKL